MRKFVVCIDGETSNDVSAIKEYVGNQKFGWWHWIDNVWLLTTSNPEIKATDIRDAIRKLSESKWVIVIEVNSVTWAAYGPETSERSMSKWIKEHWSKP